MSQTSQPVNPSRRAISPKSRSRMVWKLSDRFSRSVEYGMCRNSDNLRVDRNPSSNYTG